MTNLDTKFQILEKAIKAVFKCTVTNYFINGDMVFRINLTTLNFKDFIYTISPLEFREKPVYQLMEDIVLAFVSYTRDFWIDSQAYDMASSLLLQHEQSNACHLIDKAMEYTE